MNNEKAYGALSAGVVAISFAAVFIKLADAPAASVAAVRLIFASLILLPFFLSSRRARKAVAVLDPGDKRLLVLSGFFLAIHFLSWIASLSFTGITSSIVFVTTSPIFIEIYSVAVHRERTSVRVWAGIAVAAAGSAILAGGNIASGGAGWKGDLLAVIGAAAVSGYFLVGKSLRPRLPLIGYIFPVYSTAAVLLALTAPLMGEPILGLPLKTYFYCFLMALVCQVAGHSLFNWALSRIKTTLVAMATLGEPIGTTLLAWMIIDEVPAGTELIGGAVILAGVFVVLTGGRGAVRV